MKMNVCSLVTLTFLGICFANMKASAQVSYDDVAVIVNTTCSTSVAIGEYFAAARSIPRINMIPVVVPVREEIDSTTFNDLRAQVETYLQSHNLTNTINYLVTTKGVPLKVNRGSISGTMSSSSSVESELALILGPYSQAIGQGGSICSPYYQQSGHFSRTEYGIYLVTRLDGYTLADVFGLIDHGGPQAPVDTDALYVLDQDPSTVIVYLNSYLAQASDLLVAKGKNVLLNQDSVFVTGKTDVVAYVSWGSNDRYANQYTENAKPHNSWARGAIAETYVSSSGRSFAFPPSYGQSLIADLIAEGVSGAKGYVYEPYTGAMAVGSILLDRYTSGYNLAESYSMASRFLSWMDVIVGDPKTSIDQPAPGAVPTVTMQFFRASEFKGSRRVDVTWGTLSEHNNAGFAVQRRDPLSREFADLTHALIPGGGTTILPRTYAWTDRSAPHGTCYYRLRYVDMNGIEHFTDSVAVTIGPARIERTNLSTAVLAQNYPNPFNPTTVVSYQLPDAGTVRLVVYDMLGREVAVLVNGRMNEGTHEVTFDGSGLASGIYVYRLDVQTANGGPEGNYTATRRFMLLK